jgi:chromosome segregation protein
VHLKTMTLRGFKSFASATTLRFEPGITCVVGPNGSGKANVVDALAWVMGEQGAKSLRGGKMEDVIFAGTAGRPPLGRAEVTLTIDNADGALPIEYSEVTISRIMFRNGGSEYAINGNPCRLLDIQELLSDSGIGREMHVIVGQGQLDSVLSATAEDRRGFIEEAAGVLKHRKRKEKALRKLDAMQSNLVRLQDLTAELRRQLKPLGRQAEVARRAAVVQADLRDARLRLLADDLDQMRTTLEAEVADEALILQRRALVEAELTQARERETELERIVQSLTPRLARAQETWYRLSSLRERLRGTAGLAAERTRHLATPPAEERRGRDPEDMEREAAAIREQESELAAAVAEAQEAMAQAVEHRAEAEAALAAEEQRLVTAQRAAADRREGLARLGGQVNTARSKAAAAEAELGRLTEAHAAGQSRAAAAEEEYQLLRAEVGEVAEPDSDVLDAEYDQAAGALAEAEERQNQLRSAERDAGRERAALAARKEALELGLSHKDGSGALLAADDRLSGLVGSVAALVTVAPGAETALAAALGSAADAVAVDSLDTALDAVRLLRETDAGRAGLLVSGGRPDGGAWPELADGQQYAVDLVTVDDALRPSLTRLLDRVAVVADLAAARALVTAHPDLRAVTRDGDVVGAGFVQGGLSGAPSLLEVQAAVDEAAERLAGATERCARLRAELAEAAQTRTQAKARLDDLTAARREHERRASAAAQQLGRLGGQARAAAGEVERLERSVAAAQESLARHQEQLLELEERLVAAEELPATDEPDADARDRLATACSSARQAEMEARLAARTGEERVRAITGRADSLARAAQQERVARARAIARRERMARQAAVATAVSTAVAAALRYLEVSLTAAAAERESAERARTSRDGEMTTLRARVRELAAELDQLTDAVHRDEVARTEQRMLIQRLEQQALEEFGVDADALIAEYGPEVPVPPSPPAVGEERSEDPDHPDNQPRPYVRAEQEKRLKAATRALTLLGKVNPLALEEFAALEERHKFLTEQLEDLKATRRDLLTVIKDVDERVEQVFTAAYHDTAREFEGVFSRLFPGGEGRLILTDPSDMLTTGIEVEARPPGKKVKRLSLLSGGERSLTAVALLVAIFKARPSPFYVMDEVEAALDDTNLQRLLKLMAELRESSQLIVITHQKRTMEIADALYGVSMRGDGVTTVISQRLRESEPA